MTAPRRGRDAWTGTEAAVLAAAAALGIYWRLRGLDGQLLLDDEWHALNFVIGKPFFSLFAAQGAGANSIPVNLYEAFLFKTVGWSETLLRLPTLAAGLAALAALPLLVRRLWGSRVAAVFAFLLAFSPLAVFYSRNCRPYSVAMLFGFLSLLAALSWRKERKRAWGWAYVFCGFVAVAFHMLAAIPVFTPLLVFGAEGVWTRQNRDSPDLRELAAAGFVLTALLLAFLAPANLANPWWLHVGHYDRVTLGTAFDLTALVSGSISAGARVLFCALAAAGLAVFVRRDLPAALVFATAGALYLTEVVASGQEGSHSAILIARYGITLLPAAFVLVGAGADAAARALEQALPSRREAVFPAVAALLLGGLFWAGPLPRIYASGSNFAHHSAFQYDYAPMDWSRSRERDLIQGYVMRREDVSPCYAELARAPGLRGFVEYPVMAGDHLDAYYYPQHFHGLPVAGGYRTGLSFPSLPSRDEFVYGDTPLDYVFSRVPAAELGRLKFSNLVDVGSAEKLRERYAGWAVVVHRDPLHEAFPLRFPHAREYGPAAETERGLRAAFGPPACDSGSVRAYRIEEPKR